MARFAGHLFICIPLQDLQPSRRHALAKTTRCGLAKLQTVIHVAFDATDPDEGRTRGTHSLAGKLAPPSSSSVTPRAGPNLLSSTLAVTRRWFCVLLGSMAGDFVGGYAGSANASPRRNTAQAMRAFFAAMATAARQ